MTTKGIQDIPMGNKDVKQVLFTIGMTCIWKMQQNMKKKLVTNNKFSNIIEYNINEKLIILIYTKRSSEIKIKM